MILTPLHDIATRSITKACIDVGIRNLSQCSTLINRIPRLDAIALQQRNVQIKRRASTVDGQMHDGEPPSRRLSLAYVPHSNRNINNGGDAIVTSSTDANGSQPSTDSLPVVDDVQRDQYDGPNLSSTVANEENVSLNSLSMVNASDRSDGNSK